MNLKKIVFLFFSLACLPSIQINAALTPSTVSSAACCRPLGAVAQRAPNHFSCESFAQQGIYLPPCDKAQARLWHGILQDPELQGDQPTSSWSPGALTAAVGIGAAGTMTLYNLHQLRNARQRAADKALEGEIDFQRPPTIVEVPAQQPTPKIIAPVASTPWWKQSIMPAAAAFVSGGLGSLAAFKYLQNQPHNAATTPIIVTPTPAQQPVSSTTQTTFVSLPTQTTPRLPTTPHLSELPLHNLLDRQDSDLLSTTRSTDSTQERWKKINGTVDFLSKLRRNGLHPIMYDDLKITVPVTEQEEFKKFLRLKKNSSNS